MQDYLREIEGTLARKNERQNTLLYKLAKRNAEEERLSRLGVRILPSNPLEVSDAKVVKYVLFKLKRDIGDRVARLRNPQLLSIETQGEVVIRSKNDEINHLIARKNLWEGRLAALTGKKQKVASSKKLYFGCARELPEATQVEMKKGENENAEEKEGEDEALDESESESLDSHSSEGTTSYSSNNYLEQLALDTSEEFLLGIEKAAELSLRCGNRHDNSGSLSLKREREEKTKYVLDVDLPPEEEFHRRALDARKKMLQKRIESLRK